MSFNVRERTITLNDFDFFTNGYIKHVINAHIAMLCYSLDDISIDMSSIIFSCDYNEVIKGYKWL
jgi:hypothetical protein